MTRKHFEETAKIVSMIEDENIREIVACEFCKLFKKENPRFQAEKFLAACGITLVVQ